MYWQQWSWHSYSNSCDRYHTHVVFPCPLHKSGPCSNYFCHSRQIFCACSTWHATIYKLFANRQVVLVPPSLLSISPSLSLSFSSLPHSSISQPPSSSSPYSVSPLFLPTLSSLCIYSPSLLFLPSSLSFFLSHTVVLRLLFSHYQLLHHINLQHLHPLG